MTYTIKLTVPHKTKLGEVFDMLAWIDENIGEGDRRLRRQRQEWDQNIHLWRSVTLLEDGVILEFLNEGDAATVRLKYDCELM